MIRSASESKFGLSYRVFVWRAAILGALAASALGVAVAQEPKREFAQVLTLATTAVAEPMLRSLAARYAEAARVELRVTVHTAAEAADLARAGKVDLLILDDEKTEEALVVSNDAAIRHDVMYAELVVVGPASDPAGVAGMASVVHAMAAIARTQSFFLTRGDGSLIERVERAIWNETGASPKLGQATWYARSSADMAATLAMAAERNAYTLTDKAAWLQLANRRQLVVVVSDDPRLQQRLALTLVNPAKHKTVNKQASDAFAAWLTSLDAQRLIGAYSVRGEYPFAPHFGLSK